MWRYLYSQKYWKWVVLMRTSFDWYLNPGCQFISLYTLPYCHWWRLKDIYKIILASSSFKLKAQYNHIKCKTHLMYAVFSFWPELHREAPHGSLCSGIFLTAASSVCKNNIIAYNCEKHAHNNMVSHHLKNAYKYQTHKDWFTKEKKWKLSCSPEEPYNVFKFTPD